MSRQSKWILGFILCGSLPTFAKTSDAPITTETLRKFAPASLDPEMSRKIQSMLDIRAPGMGMIHPDGKRLFFTWRVTGTSQIWRMDKPEGFPVQMTGGEEATSLMDITADGKYLVISRDRNGEENPGLYFQAVDGGSLELVQHQPHIQTVFEFSSENSEWIYFRANDIEPDSFAIYRFSLKTKKKELVFSHKGYWAVVDHKGPNKLLLNLQISSTVNEIYEYDLTSKALTPLFGKGEGTEYEVVYGPREAEYFVVTPRGEYRGLFQYYQGKEKALAPGLKGDVISVGIDLARKHLAYVSNQSAYMKLTVLDAKNLSVRSLSLPKDADHTYSGWMSRDGKEMMVAVESGQSPRTSFSYNFDSGKLTRWVIPSVPEVDLRKFVKAEPMDFTARDGTKIPMFVRKPSQCDRELCPVIVHFHGGPESQSMPGFSVLAQLFVDEGFIFVEPNVRGSEGYGQTWLHADDGSKRLKVITDLEDCSSFIKKNWAQSGKAPKIGVMGWSYGGYAALYAMTRFSGAYDAGVSIVGMSNLLTFMQNTPAYRRALRIPEYGDPAKDQDLLLELSPSTHLAKLKDPLLVIQGAEDPRVPIVDAVQFYREMQAKGIAGNLIIFPDEGHGADKRGNQVLEIGHTLSFFKEHLD